MSEETKCSSCGEKCEGTCCPPLDDNYLEPNETRYYLGLIQGVITRGEFKPTAIITAVKLPTGAIEIAINHEFVLEKIGYILGAYDEHMKLISNPEISMANIMIV
jgi:hypothetical protein